MICATNYLSATSLPYTEIKLKHWSCTRYIMTPLDKIPISPFIIFCLLFSLRRNQGILNLYKKQEGIEIPSSTKGKPLQILLITGHYFIFKYKKDLFGFVTHTHIYNTEVRVIQLILYIWTSKKPSTKFCIKGSQCN